MGNIRILVAVTLDGRQWTQFDAEADTVAVPAASVAAGRARHLQLAVSYR